MNDDNRALVIAAVCALIFVLGSIIMRLINEAFPIVFTVYYTPDSFWWF